MNNLPTYRKAVAAFIVGLGAFLAVILPLLQDGISTTDIIAIAGALAGWLGGTGAVYQTPNEPVEGK